MNFDEVEKIIEEGKFKKAVAGALLGATLASGAMAQDAKIRTRRPSNPNPNRSCLEWIDGPDGEPTELKDTIFQFPELCSKEDSRLFYSMTVNSLKNKEGNYLKDYLKIQKQYQNKKITREMAVKKLVDGGILSDKQAKCQPDYKDDLKS